MLVIMERTMTDGPFWAVLAQFGELLYLSPQLRERTSRLTEDVSVGRNHLGHDDLW
jgi:hypothetical protein